jgi:hypothetical protein
MLSALFLVLPALAASCQYREAALFPVRGLEAGLYGLSREASSGSLPLRPGKNYRYAFEGPLAVPENVSLELEYLYPAAGPADDPSPAELILELGDSSWVLPRDAGFLGIESGGRGIRYAVPVSPGRLEGFSLRVAGEGPDEAGTGSFELRSLALVPRWYGFDRELAALTPYVYRDEEGLAVNPPAGRHIAGKIEAALALDAPGPLSLRAGDRLFEGLPLPLAAGLWLPSAVLPEAPYPLLFRGPLPRSFTLVQAAERPFPEPIPADPGIILDYPREGWRDRRYELFRWDRFPSILIFDTSDYEMQDRFFKRLAFFAEKQGFRGRLAGDREIAGLHGWNAHDYGPEDLAAFFTLARRDNFPLLSEERELERILLAQGIIRREGGEYRAGEGAVLSVSRESADYLRATFMAHEGFHGLFFIDEDFRDFSRRRWEKLSAPAKRFILSYFGYQSYDASYPYLAVNEFMAHCLQQSASQASRYFGETAAGRLAGSWRRSALPPGDGPYWPELGEAFEAEAAAFSRYAAERWGLAAGRVRRVLMR